MLLNVWSHASELLNHDKNNQIMLLYVYKSPSHAAEQTKNIDNLQMFVLKKALKNENINSL